MKNLVWFEKFESKKFNRIYYVEGSHVYYDLIALVDEPKHSKDVFKYTVIPVPVFAREVLGEEITRHVEESGVERSHITSYIIDKTYPVYPSRVSRDDFYEMVEEEKIRKKGFELYESLSDEEKAFISEVEEKGLGLGEIENQFGSIVTTDYISGSLDQGFTYYRMACYSSEVYGMGICQCNSHPTYEEEPISLEEVLEIAKEKMVELA